MTLKVFNRKGEVLQTSEIILNCSIFYDIKLTKTPQRLFVYVSFYGPYFNGTSESVNYYNLIKGFDENLKFLNEINLGYNLNSLTSYGDILFCLANDLSNFDKLYVYDINFRLNKTIGQPLESEPYFFPITIKKIEVTEQYFIMLVKNVIRKQIVITKRSDGLEFNRFEVFSETFRVFAEKYLIMWDMAGKELRYYDLDGYIVNKTLLELTGDIKVLTDGDSDILFFDQSLFSFVF